MNQLPSTSKERLIEKIIGIINGEMPAKRVGLCICWDEDPEKPEPLNLNVFLIDGKRSTYQEWKKHFGPLENKNGTEQAK